MKRKVRECDVFRLFAEVLVYRVPMRVHQQRLYLDSMLGNTAYPLCPRCGQSVELEYQPFCGHCGQALDWSLFGDTLTDED